MTLGKYFSFQKISCELAQDGDISDAVELINHAFEYQDKAKGDKRITAEKLADRMRTSDAYVFKDKESNIVGAVYCETDTFKIHFGLLAVADSYRGSGLAKAIMDAIEKYALDHKIKELELDYMSIAPWLKKYYEKYGFVETGEREDIGYSLLIRMRKQL